MFFSFVMVVVLGLPIGFLSTYPKGKCVRRQGPYFYTESAFPFRAYVRAPQLLKK